MKLGRFKHIPWNEVFNLLDLTDLYFPLIYVFKDWCLFNIYG